MSFEAKTAKMLAGLKKEERKRLEDYERREAAKLAEQTQKKEALEQDPRFQQLRAVAYSSELREALDAYSLEAGSIYRDIKTQTEAKGLSGLRGRQVTTTVRTKAPGGTDIYYEVASSDKPNRPVGTFIVRSLMEPGIDDSECPSVPRYLELEITWREEPESRKRQKLQSYSGRGYPIIKTGYLGINANSGMGIMFLERRFNDDGITESQTVYCDLNSVIDAIAGMLAAHRLRTSNRVTSS